MIILMALLHQPNCSVTEENCAEIGLIPPVFDTNEASEIPHEPLKKQRRYFQVERATRSARAEASEDRIVNKGS